NKKGTIARPFFTLSALPLKHSDSGGYLSLI
ncbi:unnamed protein product, partial [marine sediment metagenome]